jgi:FtsP/CotA-like multicopper oxidase with cupredoxin domain
MSEETIVTDQAGEEDRKESAHQESEVSRRNFLQKSMAVASGVAISSMLPTLAKEPLLTQGPERCNPAAPGQPLQTIMEIQSKGTGAGPKTLKAVIKVLDEQKVYLGQPGAGTSAPSCNSGQMRYFSGYDASVPPPRRQVWPKVHGVPGPGPTLRAGIGDTIQITLVNNVDVRNFPNTLDVAEHGQACDQTKNAETGQNIYPGDPIFENPPNCFHGSSSCNLHFHGTHVSPSGTADNILLNIRPSPRGRDGKPVVTEDSVAPIFNGIFNDCTHGHKPILLWTDWPPAWQALQKKLLIQYDNTTTWKGQSPPPGGNGPPVLPQTEQLWFWDQKQMAAMELPQYYIGAWPTCFTIPEYKKGDPKSPVMGQAPGTHWYHAHKHGSTALNLANGMAGALIIEGVNDGDYDQKLHKYYSDKGQPLKEQVLMLQQFSVVLGLLRASGTSDLVSVNGNYQPVLEMKPNETQMWRFINACHQAPVPLNTSPDLKWVQTAQDGIQLHPDNYNPDPSAVTNTFPVPAKTFFIGGKWLSTGSLAPGNRVDLLVRAPNKTGDYPVTFGSNKVLMIVRVTGTAVSSIAFPSKAEFPKMPEFLADIKPPVGMVKRDIRFNTTKTQFASPTPTPNPQGSTGGRNPSPAPAPLMANAPPMHTINGKQFSGEVDQYMKLNAIEEWTLFNDTPTSPAGGPAHPFHIHINPFQIVRWFDPALNLPASGVPMAEPWVWWDNFAIPVGGWVKMWTRFADFTGKYVFHCHIVGHEDRGMMQLVEVKPSGTVMTHK